MLRQGQHERENGCAARLSAHPRLGNFPGPEDVDKNGNRHIDGSTWTCLSRSTGLPPEYLFGPEGVDRLYLADMNGDRIQDVVYLQETDNGRVVSYRPGMGNAMFDDERRMARVGSTIGEVEVGPDARLL